MSSTSLDGILHFVGWVSYINVRYMYSRQVKSSPIIT